MTQTAARQLPAAATAASGRLARWCLFCCIRKRQFLRVTALKSTVLYHTIYCIFCA